MSGGQTTFTTVRCGERYRTFKPAEGAPQSVGEPSVDEGASEDLSNGSPWVWLAHRIYTGGDEIIGCGHCYIPSFPWFLSLMRELDERGGGGGGEKKKVIMR